MPNLVYDRMGPGVPLVFLHAFPLTRRMWLVNTPAFSRNFQVITMDLPGFGQSEGMGEIATMEAVADRVISTLDAMNLNSKPVFIGCSMGGYVLFQLLKKIPDRIRAVVLCSTRSAGDTEEGKARRAQTIEVVQKEGSRALSQKMIPILFGKSLLEQNPPVVAEVKSWIDFADPSGVCAALRGMAARPDSTPLLSQIKVPTLVLSGQEDAGVSPDEMKAMAEKIPNSEFHIIPKAGHLLNLEQPHLFQDLFLHFLKRRVL